MFIVVVVVFVFVLFGVIFQEYVRSYVLLKLHFRNKIYMNCFKFSILTCEFWNSLKEKYI
jgi:hypothetical protein